MTSDMRHQVTPDGPATGVVHPNWQQRVRTGRQIQGTVRVVWSVLSPPRDVRSATNTQNEYPEFGGRCCCPVPNTGNTDSLSISDNGSPQLTRVLEPVAVT